MNIKEKYYTPTSEEFHLGFEFQFLTGGTTWKPFVLDNNRIERVFENLRDNPEMFRVKYLSRECIESLGWIGDEISGFDTRYLYYPPKSDKFIVRDYFELNHGEISSIVSPNNNTVFMGRIKNKSELKKLMSQLGI